jgi:hypothetical protein
MLLLKSCGFPFILNPVFFLFLFRFERAGNRIVIRCAGRLDLRPGPARRSRYDELGELLQLPTTHTHTVHSIHTVCVCSLVVVVVVVLV